MGRDRQWKEEKNIAHGCWGIDAPARNVLFTALTFPSNSHMNSGGATYLATVAMAIEQCWAHCGHYSGFGHSQRHSKNALGHSIALPVRAYNNNGLSRFKKSRFKELTAYRSLQRVSLRFYSFRHVTYFTVLLFKRICETVAFQRVMLSPPGI